MAERGESSIAAMLKETEVEKSPIEERNITVEDESNAEYEEGKKVKLVTSDGVTMEVEISIVKEMEIIRKFIDDNENDDSITFPLFNVTSHILNRIIELAEKEYDEELMKKLSHDELKEMLIAADYLNMKNLFHVIATAIANIIKNKSVEFVRDFFGIVNDFTPEEEAELRKTNGWAFECVDED